MLTLLLGVALAQPAAPLTCLTPAEVEARILDPLHRLDRCRAEVQIQTARVDEGARLLAAEHAARLEADARAEDADRRRKRANRRAVVAGPAGAGVGAVVLLIVLVLL
jgi:hypothetical protein